MRHWYIILAGAIMLLGTIIGIAITVAVEPSEVQREIKSWRSAYYTRPCPPLQIRTRLSPGDTIRAWDGARYLHQQLGVSLHTQKPTTPYIEIVDGGTSGMCADPDQAGYTTNNGEIGSEPTRFVVTLCVRNIKQNKKLQKLGVTYTTAHELLHVWMGKPDAVRSHPVWESGLFAADPTTTTIGPVVRGVLGPHLRGCRR
jgi:hypothetical protein